MGGRRKSGTIKKNIKYGTEGAGLSGQQRPSEAVGQRLSSRVVQHSPPTSLGKHTGLGGLEKGKEGRGRNKNKKTINKMALRGLVGDGSADQGRLHTVTLQPSCAAWPLHMGQW